MAPTSQIFDCEISQILSVDAMGGDLGPEAIVSGLSLFTKQHPDARIILHGPTLLLTQLIDSQGLSHAVSVREAPDHVKMTDKPTQILRHSKKTSMWSSIEAVKQKEASLCISCGNTGALMAMSMLRLRKADGVNRPAIACLWPSNNVSGFNVMLDAGADIRADQNDLLTYALMGASYARNALNIDVPRVGLLNVGTEEHKGRAELKLAHEMIEQAAETGGYEYIGFVEGGDIASTSIDVTVTDGFTGNIALKTGEGIAKLLAKELRTALTYNLLSTCGALLARGPLKRFKRKMDPRRANGGIFLGLNQTVIKSHGSADATGISAALELGYKLAQRDFSERLAMRISSSLALVNDSTDAL